MTHGAAACSAPQAGDDIWGDRHANDRIDIYMAVSGSVDAVEGAYVSGWAFDEDHPRRACRIRIEDEAGQVVATGRASHDRPDLMELGLGRSDFAFRVALPQITERRLLHVRANDVALPNSPLKVGAGQFDGFAIAGDGYVSGWVTERISGFSPPHVEVTDQDGRLIGQQVAAFDPDGADRNFRPGRFRMEIPDWAFENRSLLLSVAANGVVFSVCSIALRLLGYLDVVTPDRCAGWLFSPDATARRFRITARQEGRIIGSGTASMHRADIADQHPGAGEVGFDFPLRLRPGRDLRPHDMSFRLANASHELFDGPLLVADRPAMVALTRRAARLAQRGAEHAADAAAGALLRSALQGAIARARGTDGLTIIPASVPPAGRRASPEAQPRKTELRMTIIVPVYRDVAVTRTCLDSVIAMRDAARDRLVIVEDCSPDAEMADMLHGFAEQANVILLRNPDNLGFVKSVNRALAYCLTGDVLLLNSDTRLFAGALDELAAVLRSAGDIATVTAMSNNATIFSYPHPGHAQETLCDATWQELAGVALAQNRGRSVDVPTAHGFCMLIRAEILGRLHGLNEIFGRGYGEENDFCQRAADLGYRHVAACGVLVEHRESVSFADGKAELLATNLAILEDMYPEYTPTIMAFERADPLRAARRALDLHRLRASAGGYLVVMETWLGGGSKKAATELSALVLAPGQQVISVRCRRDGMLAVAVPDPWIAAEFAADEMDELLTLLDAARPGGVIIHHVLGYDEPAVRALTGWIGRHPTVIYLHDFYAICPRVTLIDAVEEFCGVASPDVCTRCVALGGAHEASRLGPMTIAAHREMFAALLAQARLVVSPSQDAADWVARAWPDQPIAVIPHPDVSGVAPARRRGRRTNIVLLGAIGPHKGSNHLLEIARRSQLSAPDLHFHVLGHTDRDEEFAALRNVTISGNYTPDRLDALAASADACAALFLHTWPETYSYTLSEAARLGLVPIVPDIGAPAARVRAASFGIVYPFPIVPKDVVGVLAEFAAGRLANGNGDAGRLLPEAGPVARIAAVFRQQGRPSFLEKKKQKTFRNLVRA